MLFTTRSSSRSPALAVSHCRQSSLCSLMMTLRRRMPEARNRSRLWAISGRPATATMGLLDRQPSARSRVPSPAAIMPPRRIGPPAITAASLPDR